jgi:hypothetical protein
MKNLPAIARRALLAATLCALLGLPLLTSAMSPQSGSVTVVNSSSNEIDNVFFATSADNWGPDQLNNAVLAPGASASFNVSCSGTITVVTEDGDGCFVYSPTSCSGGTVTVTNSSARDCGN